MNAIVKIAQMEHFYAIVKVAAFRVRGDAMALKIAWTNQMRRIAHAKVRGRN
jgi:hypothetical protein